MLKKVLIGIAAILVMFLAYVAIKSPNYEIERSISINASPDKIFPYLNNMKLADSWGPWKEMDPAAQMTHSGAEEGVGAKSSWTGGEKLGTGSATIVESVPNERVRVKLEYTEPTQMDQDAEYLSKPEGAQSVVTWRVQGKNNFIGRLMCVFVDMDAMVGDMFEKGLSNLKNLVEGTK
jgi:hypothetical protein